MLTVSAIVPTLNEAARIEQTLGALRAEPVDELIVVDGGSTDDTVALARKLGARILRTGQGRGPQLDGGAAAATADVLWFVHADTLVPQGAVAAIRHALRDPFVVGGAFRRQHQDESARPWLRPLLPLADWRQGLVRVPYGDQAMFVRRSDFEAVGGFRGQLLMEDLDLGLRLRRRGRLELLHQVVQVSARRYAATPVRATLAMTTFPTLYRLGVPAPVLARLYGNPR